MKRLLSVTAFIMCSAMMLCSCASSKTTETTTSEPAIYDELKVNEEDTIESLKQVSDGIYELDYYGDYKLDEYINAGIKDIEGFDTWMTENLTHNIPTGDIPDSGCSSFAVTDPDGAHLFGRNYEEESGDALVIRTAPKDGYASIGIVDLNHLNLGERGAYSIESDDGKLLLLAAPWCICDGINSEGLGISTLRLDKPHTVTDTDKTDLNLYAVPRVVLDKCANVDEAIALLGQYDIYSPKEFFTYHFFITDKTGRSVVVEWMEGEMYVIEDTAVTNFPLYENRISLDYDQRYTKIHNRIDDATVNSIDAMGILDLVTQSPDCRWSAVYNLDDFTVDVCFNENYEKAYSFEGKIS